MSLGLKIVLIGLATVLLVATVAGFIWLISNPVYARPR